MNTPTKRWQIAQTITPEAAQALHGYPPILQQILFNRGYATHETARQFLEAKSLADTDPFQLADMHLAVECIQSSLEANQTIAVYGDYDVEA